ncbi:hypothetical protein FKM82_012470 [Ascaphus truei]
MAVRQHKNGIEQIGKLEHFCNRDRFQALSSQNSAAICAGLANLSTHRRGGRGIESTRGNHAIYKMSIPRRTACAQHLNVNMLRAGKLGVTRF